MIASRRAVARLGPAPAARRSAVRSSPLARLGRIIPLPARTRAALANAAGDEGVAELAGRKVVFSMAGFALALLLTKPPAAFAAAPLFVAAGWRAPELRLARRARERDLDIRAALPDALDLLAACALAGMSLDRALRTVAADVAGPLGDAMRDALRALDVGMRRAAAYRLLADRASVPEVRSLVRALERAERYGTSVATTLVAQARELRARRRIAAEEAARTAPVKMLFPLVVCFLPAFVILTVAPVVLSALRSFQAR